MLAGRRLPLLFLGRLALATDSREEGRSEKLDSYRPCAASTHVPSSHGAPEKKNLFFSPLQPRAIAAVSGDRVPPRAKGWRAASRRARECGSWPRARGGAGSPCRQPT